MTHEATCERRNGFCQRCGYRACMAADAKDGATDRVDPPREESGKSDLVERLRARKWSGGWSGVDALLTEAANALAAVEAEIQGRDNTIVALEFLKNQAEARALTAETRLSGMVEAVTWFTTDQWTGTQEAVTAVGQAYVDGFNAACADHRRRALSVLAGVEGPGGGG